MSGRQELPVVGAHGQHVNQSTYEATKMASNTAAGNQTLFRDCSACNQALIPNAMLSSPCNSQGLHCNMLQQQQCMHAVNMDASVQAAM